MKIRTSYSSRELLHRCERKFQLYKLVKSSQTKEEASYFSHGHAYGAGVASYLLNGDKEKALFDCWNAYWPNIEDEGYSAYHSMAILEASWMELDKLRNDWEVATFNGRPAVELGVRLNLNSEIYDVGFLDLAMKNKKTRVYAVFDIKTTANWLNDISPMYKNSSQCLGYSIPLDKIARQNLDEFFVYYIVAQTKQKKIENTEIHVLKYRYSIIDRLNWFFTLGLDIEHLQKLQKMNYFPMRGDNCLSFNKPCPHFGTCNLRKTDIPREDEIDETKYDFEFFMDDIVKEHVERVKLMLIQQNQGEGEVK